jgi:hypothetical protein
MIPAASPDLQPAEGARDHAIRHRAGGEAMPSEPIGGDWKRLWREAIRDPRELLSLLDLDRALPVSDAAAMQFPLRVPRGFAARMRRGDPDDPLLRQVLPLDDEMQPVPGFTPDAVGDGLSRAGQGVIHKYQGRALLVATASCAVPRKAPQRTDGRGRSKRSGPTPRSRKSSFPAATRCRWPRPSSRH